MIVRSEKSASALMASQGFDPDYAVAPGETLKEAMEALGLTQRDLAARTGLTAKTINLISNGKAPITIDTALRLERVTGVPARLWNNLEHRYQERIARIEERKRLTEDLYWLKSIPTRELAKRGAIRLHDDRAALLGEVLQFFGVASVAVWKRVWSTPPVSFRRSTRVKSNPGAVAVWVRLAEIESLKVSCQPYDEKRFKNALHEIRKLTMAEGTVVDRLMGELCAAAGVALVFVPGLKGTPVSGAARWLTPEKAMIALSLRHKSDDHFWFSFFHEAAHVLNDSKKELFVDWGDVEADPREKAANRFAATFLIPADRAAELKDLRTEAAILQFAHSINVAPGVVVGRLQRDEFIPFNRCNSLKRKLEFGHGCGV